MHKILSLIVIAGLAFTLVSCKKPAPNPATASRVSQQAAQTARPFSFEFDGFRYKSWDISPIMSQLKEAASDLPVKLKSVSSNSKITVYGHADKSGPENAYRDKPGNVNISQKRAQAVVNYLVKNFGLDAGQFIVIGKGSSELKNPSRPYDKVNRRVQIVYP